ncbi:hypothetical protein GGI24_004680 [Coemansia furcata]|nr:hypothetical protein GGI24_004680 [Coemansia furcata]
MNEAAGSALAAEADSAMAVSEVTPEPSSPGSSQEPAAADPAPTNGDSSEIAPEAPHGDPAAEDGPKEDVREQAVGGPVDAVREMRDLEERIGHCLRTFDEAPFTIQRIAELLAWPERHYRSGIKFLRAVERVVYVTSTVDEFPLTADRSAAEPPIDMPIESDSNARAASASLFSFLAVAQDGQPTDVAAAVQTKAVTMRPPSYAKPAESPSALLMQGPGGAPPLDASDTGILHIAPMAGEDARAKIGASGDTAGIPVCIDELDGRSGKVAVRPVHIGATTMETSPKE